MTATAKRLDPRVAAIAARVVAQDVDPDELPPPPPPPPPQRVGEILEASIERAQRRSDGREKPIPMPLRILLQHYGGGLWPGLHYIAAGTGVGKTQYSLQAATCAAKSGVPVLYIGLELGDLDLALRLLGEEARVPWSKLWTGDAGPVYLDRVRAAVPALSDLPFHYEVARPHGFPPSAIRTAIDGMRRLYPETDGPGSRPIMVVVDFLQLVGEEELGEDDLRVRIGRASYVLRDAANRLGVAVLAISSVARERYRLFDDIRREAKLTWECDESGRPINRRILSPDAIVGAGKESGDIEFSADSVSVIAKVGATFDGTGVDVVFATAKGRATGANWSPLHYTGFRYEECADDGARLIEAWNEAGEARERQRADKASAKEDAKAKAIAADAEALRSYVAANPRCLASVARTHVVANTSRRWTAAVAYLGAGLVQKKVGKEKQLSLAKVKP